MDGLGQEFTAAIPGLDIWGQQTTRDGRRTRQFQGEIGPSLVRNHGQGSYLKAGVKAGLSWPADPPGGH